MLKKILITFFILLPLAVSSQVVTRELPTELVQETVPGEGRIIIHEEAGISFLLSTLIEMNERHKYVDGYRIQLYSGSGQTAKHKAMEVKGDLLKLFPDEPVYISFNAPFWRVRVGNYRNKNEALGLLNKLKREFPNGYIVKDGTIKLEDLEM